MATYITADVTGAVIRGHTRLQGAAFGITDEALETALAAKKTNGEDDVFSSIGTGYETDDGLTARQIRHLIRAVSHRTAAVFLWELYMDVVGGTYEPLLVGEPGDVLTLMEENEKLAEKQEDLLQGRGETSGKRPRSKPAVSASTYSTSSTDRKPSERLRLLDESDDISSSDLDHG